MSVKQELCDTDADGFEDSIVSGYRSPAAGKVAVCDVVTEPPVDTPIPVLGPSNLTNEVVAPALGPVDVASDLAPAYSGPYNLSASVVAPALGPSIVQSSIAVSNAGPSNISASIAAPALGPANLAEVTGVSELTPRETLVGDLETYKAWGQDFAVNENGDRMIVGVPRMDPNYWGGAKVYELQESGWVQMGSDIEGIAVYSGQVGSSVDMNSTGDRVIVGSYATHTIAAYEWDGSDWTMMGSRIDESASENKFGNLVKMNSTGTIIAAGAPQHSTSTTDINQIRLGHIKLFEWNGSDWVQKGPTIMGDRYNRVLGEAFDINDTGDRVAVGDGVNNYNNVIVYELDGDNWVQLGQTVEPVNDPDPWRFGRNVTMNKAGNRIAASNITYSNWDGAVYVYELNGTTWELMGTRIEGLEDRGHFGDPRVAFNDAGDRIAIPTWQREDIETDTQTGLLSVYQWDGTDWRILHENYAMIGEQSNTRYAYVTHLNGSGSKVFASAEYFKNESGETVGKIYSYDLPTEIPNITQKPLGGPTNLEAPKPAAGPQNLLAGEAPVLGPTNMLGEFFMNYLLFTTYEDRIYGCNTWLPNWFDSSILVISQTPGRQRFAVPVGTSPEIRYRKWGDDGQIMDFTSMKYARWVDTGFSGTAGNYNISHDRFHLDQESPLWITRTGYDYWGLTRTSVSDRKYTIMTDIEGTVGYSSEYATPIENFYATSTEIEEAIANGTITSLNYLEARVKDIYIGSQTFNSSSSSYQYPNYCDTSIFEG